MMPLLSFFSQQIFYGKRRREWYVLRALGASRRSRLQLLLTSGGILLAINLLVMLLPGLLADYLAFKLCNEWLPAGGFIPSVLMEYHLSPTVIPVLLLFSVISGLIPCLIEYIRIKRSFAAEDAVEQALHKERESFERGEP
jgi:ABC-type antimicrobial peptide transport system permease subunit